MIRVTKEEKAPEVLEGEPCRKQVQENVRNQTFNKNAKFYSHDKVRRSLVESLHGKCAYCEVIPRGTIPQVDHYRPKKKVKEEPEHRGYYWLGHEWNNLLLACPTCNRKKDNKFPIEGSRVYAPSLDEVGKFNRLCTNPTQPPLFDEKPLLLHPEWDNPFRHLKFHPDGQLEGLTPNGEATIKICELNRGDLIEQRKGIIDEYVYALREILAGFVEEIITTEGLVILLRRWRSRVIAETAGSNAFAGLRRQAFWRYEQFYVQQLSQNEQWLIRALFEEVINNSYLLTLALIQSDPRLYNDP